MGTTEVIKNRILLAVDCFLFGLVAGVLYGKHGTLSVDPEWLYLILAVAVAIVTGVAELWRQRGVESKISDLESKILDLQVETKYHAKLLSDLEASDDDGGTNE